LMPLLPSSLPFSHGTCDIVLASMPCDRPVRKSDPVADRAAHPPTGVQSQRHFRFIPRGKSPKPLMCQVGSDGP
jgi:hypothetical protein